MIIINQTGQIEYDRYRYVHTYVYGPGNIKIMQKIQVNWSTSFLVSGVRVVTYERLKRLSWQYSLYVVLCMSNTYRILRLMRRGHTLKTFIL